MLQKSHSAFSVHRAHDRKSARKVVIDSRIPGWTIFFGIYLALAIFAIAAGSPPDPGGLGLSP